MQAHTDLGVHESSINSWMQLFEATLLEADPQKLAERLRLTKDAIMDRIDDWGDNPSQSEVRLLLAALKTVGEIERLSVRAPLQHYRVVRPIGDLA